MLRSSQYVFRGNANDPGQISQMQKFVESFTPAKELREMRLRGSDEQVININLAGGHGGGSGGNKGPHRFING